MPAQDKQKAKPIISDQVGNYEKHPFFVKKAAQADALLKVIGLPPNTKKSSTAKPVAKVTLSSSVRDQHVIPHQDGWAIKGSGNEKATVVLDTQREAIEAAREIARNKGAELIIHGKDGKIRHRDSYAKEDTLRKEKKR